MVFKDEWTRAAMSDDVVVVQLLLRLKESRAASSSSSFLYQFTAKSVIPRWGLRLPRSKASASSSSRCDAVWRSNNKKDDSTRCSPTTPLSWSGGSGGSPSGTADGFEESSRPRSKVSLSHSLYVFRFFVFGFFASWSLLCQVSFCLSVDRNTHGECLDSRLAQCAGGWSCLRIFVCPSSRRWRIHVFWKPKPLSSLFFFFYHLCLSSSSVFTMSSKAFCF